MFSITSAHSIIFLPFGKEICINVIVWFKQITSTQRYVRHKDAKTKENHTVNIRIVIPSVKRSLLYFVTIVVHSSRD